MRRSWLSVVIVVGIAVVVIVNIGSAVLQTHHHDVIMQPVLETILEESKQFRQRTDSSANAEHQQSSSPDELPRQGQQQQQEQQQQQQQSFPLLPSDSFGACMMMKEDNELLYEWIAYHFEMMPLRYLVIGSDEGSMQDPRDVLGLWNGTGLQYWVLPASDFAGRHEPSTKEKEADPTWHHHQFLWRQRSFITTCAEFLQQRGVGWTMWTDSDEFLVLNRPTDQEEKVWAPKLAAIVNNNNNNNNTSLDVTTDNSNSTESPTNTIDNATLRFAMRKALPDWDDKDHTVLGAIQKLQMNVPCISMPRVRFGALENLTCGDESEQVNDYARKRFDYAEMSTLRYKMHGGLSNFKANGFGKVLLDLSKVPQEVVATITPRNVHRPYVDYCRRAVVPCDEAIFTLNHYTASWERYSSRLDERRSCEAWTKMAFYTAGNGCHQRIHQWFPRFVERFGVEKAQQLLGMHRADNNDSSTNATADRPNRQPCPAHATAS